MSAARLPVEVVTHIMRFLSLSDRKETSLVCHSWYEASLDPILQKDIIIHFYASSSVSSGRAISSLSRRRLTHLILNNFDTSLDAKYVVVKSCEHLAANLKSLSLKGSNITERTFVELLSQCKHLQSLDLSCCNSLFMSGQLLERNTDLQLLKGVLYNVTELSLSSIRFLSDAIFNRLVTVCENVEKISLASTQLVFNCKMYYPRGITKCANSSVLTFNNVLDFIVTQPCITSLNFSKTQIADENMESVVLAPDLHLKELILVGCRNITDAGVATICRHQRGIVTFDLRECPDLTNASLMCISGSLAQLEQLYLNKCKQIVDRAVSTIAQLTHLEVLDFSECSQLTSMGLIKGLCSGTTVTLTHLNLNCCSSVDDSFIEKMCECLLCLVHLDIGSCFPITDKSVHAISKNMKRLRYLRLAWCKRITDLGLLGLHSERRHVNQGDNEHAKVPQKYKSTVISHKPALTKDSQPTDDHTDDKIYTNFASRCLSNLAGLRHLDLTACKKLSDTGLAQIIKFPELKVLHLGMLPNLTDEGIVKIATNNPSIEDLNLAQCVALTDEAMKTIVTKLRRLQSLNVFGCDRLTDRSILLVQKYCMHLKHIEVSFCRGISVDVMERLECSMNTLLTVQMRMIGS